MRGVCGAYWRCRCECGTVKVVAGRLLRSGRSKSCGRPGCKQSRKRLELTGQVFGRLTVLRFAEMRKRGSYWWCRCTCGTVTIVLGGDLQVGNTKACGGCRGLPTGMAAFNSLFGEYRAGAEDRDLDFTLTKDVCRTLMKQNCAYCGAEPSRVKRGHPGRGDYIYTGIDRVDNDKGYTPSNVVACCWPCNRKKATGTRAAFLAKVKRRVEHRRKAMN